MIKRKSQQKTRNGIETGIRVCECNETHTVTTEERGEIGRENVMNPREERERWRIDKKEREEGESDSF